MPGSNTSSFPRQLFLRLGVAVTLVGFAGGWGPGAGALAASSKVVRYHRYSVVVPSSWPVFRLTPSSTQCVRFDRHALYLGSPPSGQRCPAHAAGRTEAILIEPLLSRASQAGSAAGQTLPVPSTTAAASGPGSEAQLANAARGVVVTATWRRRPAVIRRALGVRSLATLAGASRARLVPFEAPASHRAPSATVARAAVASALPGGVYTGLGFDPCATPSAAAMAAWGASPYRAIGVYVGGTNMACSQPNLTTSWVNQQSAAGWHLIPIYVGLQAPVNACGCASISISGAASQGTAAARDAVARAQAVGLGPGNPLYFDMEAYSRTSTNSTAVLTFLGSWTAQLHASGYKSGVYGSADSGIADLVSRFGSGYHEPDDIWIARWNEVRSTSDPNVPSSYWASHQRLHQYDGGHDETYGGVTINIDGDYLDGATAAGGGGMPALAATPSLAVSAVADGTIDLRPGWSGAADISSWQVLAGASPTSLTAVWGPISANAKMPIVLHSAYRYFAARALGSAGQILGTSPPVPTPWHVAISGRSVFVPRRGLGGVPVGCFRASPCRVTTTISAGRTRLATTGPERIRTGGGLAYFNLTAVGRTMLARARRHRLAATITVRDDSGVTATRQLTLISFTTSGPRPRARVAQQSPELAIIGTMDFVSRGRLGGILVACVASSPCRARTTIVAAGRTIARTRREFLGVGQLGYLLFSLTPAGQNLLAHARGNQLSARVIISTGASTATARIALVSFS